MVNTSQQDPGFQLSRFESSNLKLEPLSSMAEVPYHKSGYVNIKIINTSGYKINSLPDRNEPVMLSYRIYDLNGNLITRKQVKTPLDVDIYTEYTQAVKVDDKLDSGDYLLLIDFITGEDKWWNCGTKIQLHIPGRSMWRWL